MSRSLHTRPSAATFALAALVEQAWRGELRIPHFQRDFRWTRGDVTRLFDSIVRGYPVGSLLLWSRPAKKEKVNLGALTVAGVATDSALWVVDGQQRVSSLASALSDKRLPDERFDLAYDLTEERFVARPTHEISHLVPLPVLFDLRRLITWFARNPDVSDYLEAASAVTSSIRQFEIPAYIVEQEDENVLRDIFDRMNNYGKRLSRAEVFTALYADTGGSDDDLTIDLIAQQISDDHNFGSIDPDTVLRSILSRRGADPARDIRAEFRSRVGDFSDEDQATAFRLGKDSLERAVEFLQFEAGVPHFSLLTYRYLLIALSRFFAHYPDPGRRNRQLLRRWYWRAAVGGPEMFKGSPSYAMRILCGKIRPGNINQTIQDLLETVSGSQLQIPNVTRFRPNEASTKVITCAWWSRGPRSVFTAEPYDHAQLAATIGHRTTASVALPHITAQASAPRDFRQSAANRILLLGSDRRRGIDDRLTMRPLDIGEKKWTEVLRSHGLDSNALQVLADGRTEQFLQEREARLQEELTDFVARQCEWAYEDTPPLEDLVLDEDDDDEEDSRDDDDVKWDSEWL